jgi:hypothetical protein
MEEFPGFVICNPAECLFILNGPTALYFFEHLVKLDPCNNVDKNVNCELTRMRFSSLEYLTIYWNKYKERDSDFCNHDSSPIIKEADLQFLLFDFAFWRTVIRIIAFGCKMWKPSKSFLLLIMDWYFFHFPDNGTTVNISDVMKQDMASFFRQTMFGGYYCGQNTSVPHRFDVDLLAMYLRMCKCDAKIFSLIADTMANKQTAMSYINDLLLQVYNHPPLRAWYHVQNRGASPRADCLSDMIMDRIGRNRDPNSDPKFALIDTKNWAFFKECAPENERFWRSIWTPRDSIARIPAFDKELYFRDGIYDIIRSGLYRPSIDYQRFMRLLEMGFALQDHPKYFV